MARRTRKIPVTYDDGRNVVEYVPRTPTELRREMTRVHEAVQTAVHVMSPLKRKRHAVIKAALFQLRHLLRKLPEEMTDEERATELARISYAMEDTLGILNKLVHCRVSHLETARFILTYGQTPKKREAPASYGAKHHFQYERDLDD